MTTSTHAAAAKAIRKELKRHGIKASVRSSSFSMGSSVTVRIKQDLLPAARAKVEEFVNQFQYGHFDGMVDMYEMSNRRDDLPQVKYVSVEMQWSDEIIEAARQFAAEFEQDEHEYFSVLSGRSLWAEEFWAARKPRIRAAA